MAAHFLQSPFARHAVEIQDPHRFAARHLSANVHLRDVHPVRAENGAHEANQPGHVAVGEDEEGAVEMGVEAAMATTSAGTSWRTARTE